MKKQFLFLTSLLIIFSISELTYGQYNDSRKWDVNPQMTKVSFFGQGIPFSKESLQYKNPNKKTHVYNTPAGIVTISPNFRVYPSGISQSETPIVASSVDSNWIFGSANTFINGSVLISEGIYLSTDGGQTWFGSDTCGATPLTSHGGDPGPAIGPNGTIYMSYLDLYGNGVHCGVSTDFGITWGPTHNLVSGSMDKNLTTVNEVASSPYYGRVLVAWSDFNQSNPPIMVSWSSNEGSTWSTAVDINTANSGHYCQGVNPQVGPNGEFYLVWANPITSSPYTEDYMGFAKSTDGGVTWQVNNDIYDVNGIRGNLSDKNGIRVNGFPWMGVDRTGGPRNGWIYVVEAEKNLAPAGSDPDIIFHRSTDGGTTWSAGIRVNQDPLNDGVDQYMPALCVGSDGSINVVYYDSRNTSSSQAEVYVSHSIDGGDTWTDVQVSDHVFTPSPIPGLASGYQGDYIGICKGPNDEYYPYWCDNSSGTYQAWTTKVTFEPPIGPGYATNPYPSNGANGVQLNVTLTWSNPDSSISDEIWFGTDQNNLALVQSGSLDSSYTPGTLDYFQTYYWRIDETDGTDTTIGNIWQFTTRAEYWFFQTSGTGNQLDGVSFVDSSNGTAVGHNGTILKTTDAGETWVTETSGTSMNLAAVSFSDVNNGTAIGDAGTILRTTDGGQTWVSQTSGTSNDLRGVCFIDADHGTTVGGYGTIIHTTNGGATWTLQSSGTSNSLYGVSFINADTGTAAGVSGTILRTTNGGNTWVAQSSGTTNHLVAVSFTDVNNGTAVGQNGRIVRTTNGGTTWTSQTSGTTNYLFGVSFTDVINGTTVGFGGTILRTTDGGNTWTAQASGTTNSIHDVSFTDSFNGTAVGDAGLILRTTNGGGITPVELTSFKGSIIGGKIILKWSTASETNNRGFQIQRKNEQEHYQNLAFVDGYGTTTQRHQYSYEDKNVVNGKYTYRLKQVDFDGSFKYSNEIEVNMNLPLKFSLSQNYPNPFNPTTTIDYSIPKDGNVTLIVYNVLGQKVANLINGNMKAGEHQVVFDASRFASGVYYYRLESNNHVMVKKMLLMK